MNGAWRIALASGCVLVLELALIRQVPAEVRVIGYFTNLILMATFVGLGLGMIMRPKRWLPIFLPAGLVAVAAFIFFGRGLVIFDEASTVHYWLQYKRPEGTATQIPILLAALMAFVFTGAPFVALGRLLAEEMDRHERLVAYAWDIAGSLGGTLLFVAGSAVRLPPWVWPPLVGVVFAGVFARGRSLKGAAVLAGAAFILFSQSPHPAAWSPYYYVQYHEEENGLRVWVNSSFHQFAANVGPDANPAYRDHVLTKFGVPYDVYRHFHEGRSPERVLVLGAGTGNDVNVALHNGATEVVAVEIDPVILELGRRYNTSHPYADRRVRAVLDDARHYLRTADERFDLVVFGTLDSQTLLSGHSNLRLENYVYTQEAFSDAYDRLVEGGMLATYYSVYQPWLRGRLYQTICPAFDGACQVSSARDAYLFNTVIMAARELPEFQAVPDERATYEESLPSTDDWPFLYVEEPVLSDLYLGLLGAVAVLIFAIFIGLRRAYPGAPSRAAFGFLGVAFTMMESAAIVRLALLVGSTWTVNALVFASVLIMIFVANALVIKGRAPSLNVAWVGVILAAGVNFAVPVSALLPLSPPVQLAAAGLLIGAPVFFAAVCFSHLFAKEAATGYALGINLVGAMAGGFVEYASMIVGTRAIWALVVVFYLLAALTANRTRPARAIERTLTDRREGTAPRHPEEE